MVEVKEIADIDNWTCENSRRGDCANSGTKAKQLHNFRAQLCHIYSQSERVSTKLSDCWRNVNPSQHARHERTVKTVDFTWRNCSKEGEMGFISRKNHDHHFLGYASVVFADYFEKGRTITGQYYFDL